jgi:endonuclease III
MTPDAHAEFTPGRALDLGSTFGHLGVESWQLHRDDGAIWIATRTPLGAAALQLRQRAGTIDAAAWGAGAQWAVDHAPVLCGVNDDESGFRPLHPVLTQVHRAHPGMRIPRTDAVFEAFVPAVIGQQVTSVEARSSYHRLVAALGEPAPGPTGLRLPPSPQVIAGTPYWAFHRFGVERRRADVIIRAARSVKRLEEIVGMDMPDAYTRLRAFPGVGPWTAAKVATIALGDPDAVPVGDYHLPHAVGYLFDGTPRSTDERMLELLEPYRGHRARVLRLIAIAGISAPRFGPRQPLRHIERN